MFEYLSIYRPMNVRLSYQIESVSRITWPQYEGNLGCIEDPNLVTHLYGTGANTKKPFVVRNSRGFKLIRSRS